LSKAIEEVPHGAVPCLAPIGVPHGFFRHVADEAKSRETQSHRRYLPLVTKVHLEALSSLAKSAPLSDRHRDHQEIVGTSGEAPDRTIVVGLRRCCRSPRSRRPYQALVFFFSRKTTPPEPL